MRGLFVVLMRLFLALVFSISLVHAQSDVPSLPGNDRAVIGAPTGLSTYRLAAGDVITIRVLGEEDLSKEKIRLTDAGSVSYPALGEVKVLGLTTGDLERIITTGLKGRYLVNPKVSVQIEEYRPFYINGLVDKPGGYPYQPGLTIRKAASLAGGFKERASINKIYIIRDGDPLQRSQKAELNTYVLPGDIVTVEESFF
ncbi:polysaccharide biosynthesis/export family protein [Quatrionicoccus australiensis]|uniref:polysaccharide biosynthesis/export family protein n=1 Tax=Quatrionicoccus australiensis TaxID=138118 RepID=UPI001CF8071D|nr:polysaccharide biosynthesis/export family protein [Quatrionicoccus australiensis]UCV13955.1 polysaccharide export protein [Quatrionicoccus australiensis]